MSLAPGSIEGESHTKHPSVCTMWEVWSSGAGQRANITSYTSAADLLTPSNPSLNRAKIVKSTAHGDIARKFPSLHPCTKLICGQAPAASCQPGFCLLTYSLTHTHTHARTTLCGPHPWLCTPPSLPLLRPHQPLSPRRLRLWPQSSPLSSHLASAQAPAPAACPLGPRMQHPRLPCPLRACPCLHPLPPPLSAWSHLVSAQAPAPAACPPGPWMQRPRGSCRGR